VIGRGVHLVGSVPMANAQVVFETVSAAPPFRAAT
jgi:hypothetical protein